MALKLGWEVEAWSLPGVGAFTQLVAAIPAHVVDWTDPSSGHGGGAFTVRPDYADLDTICDPDTNTETLIRVKVDGDYVFAFYARDRVEDFDDTGVVRISGPSIEDMLNHAIVYPFDYPRMNQAGTELESAEADWYFGSENNGIRNPGFENVPSEVSNGSFEDGTVEPWRPGPATTISAVTTAPRTGTNHLLVQPTVLDAGATFTMPCLPNALYEIDVYVRTASGGGNVELGVSVPGDIRRPIYDASGDIVGDEIVGSSAQPNNPDTGTGELNIQYGGDIEDPDDPNFEGVVYVEMKAEVAATTTYQLLRVALWTGKGQTSMDISVRNRDSIFDFYVDDMELEGLMVGLTGWQVAMAWPGQPTLQGAYPIVAQAETTDPDTGTYSARVDFRRSGQGIKQVVSGIIPGHTYTVTARIKAAVGVDVRLLVTDPLGNWIPNAWDIGATGGVYASFTATFVAPEKIPGDGQTIPANSALIIKIEGDEDQAAGTFETFRVDNVSIVPGQPAATIGDILDQLLQDAAVDHIADGRTTVSGAGHLAFLQYDFDAFGDSALPTGSSWATPANPGGLEKVTVKRGMTYLQFMEQVVEQLGYEWRIIWRDPPGEWVLQVYIPGGMAVDQSGTVSLITGSVGPSRIGKNASGANFFLGEGGNKRMAEQIDTTERDAYGRRERYVPNRDLTGYDTLKSWVDASATFETGNKETHRVELNDVSTFIPYRDFDPGDIINVDLGSSLSTRDLPVKQVSARLSDDRASFLVDINTDPMPAQSVPLVALERILTRFKGIQDDFEWAAAAPTLTQTGGGAIDSGQVGGGMLSIVVAASNASAESQAKADYVCDGTDDHVEIVQALNDLQYDNGTGSGGMVQLTEGDFRLDPDLVKLSESGIGYSESDYASLRGVGPATRIHIQQTVVATGSYSISAFGPSFAALLVNDVPFGQISDLTLQSGPKNGSVPVAGIYCTGYNTRVDNIHWNEGDEPTGWNMFRFLIVSNDHTTIDGVNVFAAGHETAPSDHKFSLVASAGYVIASNIMAYALYEQGTGPIEGRTDEGCVFEVEGVLIANNVLLRQSDAYLMRIHAPGGNLIDLNNVFIRAVDVIGPALIYCDDTFGYSELRISNMHTENLDNWRLIDSPNHPIWVGLTGVRANYCTVLLGNGGSFDMDASSWIGAVDLEGMEEVMIAGRIDADVNTTALTTGIHLRDCTEAWVTGARKGWGFPLNQYTDFVTLDANCTDCVVVHNDFRGAYSGSAINDSGTGTTTTLSGNLT